MIPPKFDNDIITDLTFNWEELIKLYISPTHGLNTKYKISNEIDNKSNKLQRVLFSKEYIY